MNKTYHLRRIDNITSDIALQIQHLSDICQGYEPFFDNDNHEAYIYIGAFTSTEKLIGFMGGIILENAIEITALTHPDYRQQGIFKHMLSMAHEFYTDAKIIGNISDDCLNILSRSSIAPKYMYSDLLMKLENRPILSISTSHSPDSNKYDCYFTDEYDCFLLYEDSDDEETEPVAVCNLSFTNSYTNLWGVFVDVDKRKQGIGTVLLQDMIDIYFDNFEIPLILHVNSSNTAAVKLYEKFNFKTVEKLDYYTLSYI